MGSKIPEKEIIKPNVLRLDNEILDICYNFLKRKRKQKTVYDLHLDLYSEGFPAFDENQLMEFLLLDHRFMITESSDQSHDCYVAVVRKRSKE